MSASPAERSCALARTAARLGLAVLACAALPMSGAAQAQYLDQSLAQSQPQSLAPAPLAPTPVPLVPQKALGVATPSGLGPSIGPGRSSEPAALGTALPNRDLPNRGTSGIEVNPLAEIAPEAIGTLGPEDGGFGVDMWLGTPRPVIESLLERVPARIASPTMRELARRLLLSIAPPPSAAPAAVASAVEVPGGAMPSGLLVLRARRLAELGEVPALISLLSVVPAHAEQEPLDRLQVEAHFLSHDRDEACRLVRNGITIHHEQPFWQQAMIFCNMAAGDLDRGMLGLDLMREQGLAEDPLFFAVANRFLGIAEPLPEVEALSPLHVAMLRAAELPLPALALEQAAPGVLFAIATDPEGEPARRVTAAEVACAQGIIDGPALARGYESIAFTPEQLGNPIGAAGGLERHAARALLYQAAQRETLAATRAEILRVALEQAAEDGLFPAATALYRETVAEIDPAPQMAWFAATAGLTLYGAGEHSRASAWLALGRQEAIINPQASAAAAALWPYSRLAGGASFTTDGSLTAWHDMREAAGQAPPEGSLATLRAVFQALGEQDPLSWSRIVAQRARSGPEDAPEGAPEGALVRPGVMPDAAYLFALQDASEARRLGETVLLSAIVLGEAGPARAHDMALGAVLAALSRVGLEREARRLAIEAALARGV